MVVNCRIMTYIHTTYTHIHTYIHAIYDLVGAIGSHWARESFGLQPAEGFSRAVIMEQRASGRNGEAGKEPKPPDNGEARKGRLSGRSQTRSRSREGHERVHTKFAAIEREAAIKLVNDVADLAEALGWNRRDLIEEQYRKHREEVERLERLINDREQELERLKHDCVEQLLYYQPKM